MNHHQANELLPCLFCGSSNVAPDEWSGTDDKNGPGCGDCGALGESTSAWNRRAAPTREPAAALDEEPLSPARVKAITDAIKPGDGWDGDNWDYAVANRAFMAGFAERGRLMREISALAQSFDDAAPAAPAVPVPVNTSNISSSSSMACSVCYGTGRDVAGKRCPFDCAPAVLSAPLVAIPDVLFDGHAVYKEVRFTGGHQRTSAENVSDVLDAVVRLLKSSPSVDQAKRLVGGDTALLDWLEAWREDSIKRGFKWDALNFNMDKTVREQIAIRMERAGAGLVGGEVAYEECSLCDGSGVLDGTVAKCPNCDGAGVERVSTGSATSTADGEGAA